MKTTLISLSLFLLLTFTTHSFSQDESVEPSPAITDEIEQKTKEAIAKLLGLLNKIVENLPQYEMPEVLDNGDIIIRRKHPEKEEPQQGQQI